MCDSAAQKVSSGLHHVIVKILPLVTNPVLEHYADANAVLLRIRTRARFKTASSI